MNHATIHKNNNVIIIINSGIIFVVNSDIIFISLVRSNFSVHLSGCVGGARFCAIIINTHQGQQNGCLEGAFPQLRPRNGSHLIREAAQTRPRDAWTQRVAGRGRYSSWLRLARSHW